MALPLLILPVSLRHTRSAVLLYPMRWTSLHIASRHQALVFHQPKRIAISGGYHGCHATIAVYKKTKGVDMEVIGLDEEYQPGDVCWLETPVNPTGESR
jgi:hypothetical protein